MSKIDIGIIVGLLGVLVAIGSAIFAYYQAKAAKVQAEAAENSLKQANRLKLFSTFEIANQITVSNPKLLITVHGLDPNTSEEEAQSIAFLSLLLDAFQHYYMEKYKNDFFQRSEEHTSELQSLRH